MVPNGRGKQLKNKAQNRDRLAVLQQGLSLLFLNNTNKLLFQVIGVVPTLNLPSDNFFK